MGVNEHEYDPSMKEVRMIDELMFTPIYCNDSGWWEDYFHYLPIYFTFTSMVIIVSPTTCAALFQVSCASCTTNGLAPVVKVDDMKCLKSQLLLFSFFLHAPSF